MKLRPHINLEVRDLAASVAFYSQLLDMEPTKQKPDYANFRHDTLHLALVAKPEKLPRSPENGEHFGFELFSHDDLNAWKQRMQDAGILPHLEESQVTCCYAVADKFWLIDPDGNPWEFWIKIDDNGQTLLSSRQDTSSACCSGVCG